MEPNQITLYVGLSIIAAGAKFFVKGGSSEPTLLTPGFDLVAKAFDDANGVAQPLDRDLPVNFSWRGAASRLWYHSRKAPTPQRIQASYYGHRGMVAYARV